MGENTGQPGDLTMLGAEGMYQALYDELKRQARRERRKLRTGETFSTTALVNEAFLKISRASGFADRVHFLRTAAAAMRQVLVDAARATLAEKRGSGQKALSLDDTNCGHMPADPGQDASQLVALNDALEQLGKQSQRLVQLVECRYFGGYTEPETAEILGVTERTVRRDWIKARAYLFEALGGG